MSSEHMFTGDSLVINLHGTHGNWFYVEKRHNPHQVLYMDDLGRFYFGIREFPRVIPVIFSERREARRVAVEQGGRVAKYPYRLKRR